MQYTVLHTSTDYVCCGDRPASISGGLQIRVRCDFALARLPLGVAVVVAQYDAACVQCGMQRKIFQTRSMQREGPVRRSVRLHALHTRSALHAT
jgi:hypothetical protein